MDLVEERDRHQQSSRQPQRGSVTRYSGLRRKEAQRARKRMRAKGAIDRDLQRKGLEQRQGAGQQTKNEKSGDVRPTRPRLSDQAAAQNEIAMCGAGHQPFLSLNSARVSD